MTAKRRPLPRPPYEVQIVRPIRVEPTEYVVTSLPDDSPDPTVWQLRLVRKAPDSWAVMKMSQCLGADGEWDYEPLPSERTPAWKATHRFPYAEAHRLAIEVFPKVVWNRLRVENGKLVKADD